MVFNDQDTKKRRVSPFPRMAMRERLRKENRTFEWYMPGMQKDFETKAKKPCEGRIIALLSMILALALAIFCVYFLGIRPLREGSGLGVDIPVSRSQERSQSQKSYQVEQR